MRRRGMTLVELLIVIVIMNVLLAILFPVFARSRETRCGSSCQQNIRQIGLAIKQYLSDYDERFPSIAVANSEAFGWADGVQPYVRNTQLFQCPNEKSSPDGSPDPRRSGYTDYWYNAHLSALDETKIPFLANTILLGDGNDGQERTDARYARYGLSPSWYADAEKPSFRHKEGAHYAFGDGHVKWLKPETVTTDLPNGKNVTFVP